MEKVLKMKNNKLGNNENLTEQKVEIKKLNDITPLNSSQNNQTLTNDEKLERLSKLIQDVEHDLETNDIGKRLIR